MDTTISYLSWSYHLCDGDAMNMGFCRSIYEHSKCSHIIRPSFNNSDRPMQGPKTPHTLVYCQQLIIRRRQRRRSYWQRRAGFSCDWYTICDSRIQHILYLLTICPNSNLCIALFSLNKWGLVLAPLQYLKQHQVSAQLPKEVICEVNQECGREKQARLGELAIGSQTEATQFVAGKMYMGREDEVSQKTENCFEIIWHCFYSWCIAIAVTIFVQ